MTRSHSRIAAAIAAIALLVLVACGGDDGQTAPDGTPSGGGRPAFLQTPVTDRVLPDGVFALGWDGRGEPVVEVREAPLPDGYELETVVVGGAGLTLPVGLSFLPDGRILITEQHTGFIRLVEDGLLRDEPFAEIDDVVADTLELGLLGVAVDPAFEENRWVYAFYVEADAEGRPGRSVLVRFTERDGFGVEPQELAEFPASRGQTHNGGALQFGPDGKLYLTIGDTQREELAPDPAEPVGKVFRLNRDGSAPEDNPFTGRQDADARVFATGFRNVFGIAFHPDLPGRLIALDNAAIAGDEINIVEPGGHYGWQDLLGERAVWKYLNPVGPAGAVVYTADELSEFRNDLFFCQFHEGAPLHRVRFSDDFGRVESDSVIATGCTASIVQGPDGNLYFLDRTEGAIYRIVAP